ncbi:probable F-box protein At4g22030 [Jatropha curcas]|nr:probable F-box protein At4g22030 [Jatropha curcas]
MATLQASNFMLSSSSYKSRRTIQATINTPKIRISPLSFPKLSNKGLMEELTFTSDDCRVPKTTISTETENLYNNKSDPMVIAKLYAIIEAVADRVEMHKNIGEQRDNWNHLLLTSVNALTLAAATMCGFAATNTVFKVSSIILYVAATGFLAIMNTIQPSQLAEEQRNAARLFKQLHAQIHTMISIGSPTMDDVNEAMEKVLALDKAYPLPLLGAMLEKYPANVEPAAWWPQRKPKQNKGHIRNGNGWNKELEDEMRNILGVLKRNDKADYLKLGSEALKVHKMLAISGPILTGLGALGSAFVGINNPLAVTVGVVSGALASIVNTMEHGAQVGMVVEMYRSNAGFFKLMEESIEFNISERRENGELFEMKTALLLGRSISELKNLAASSSSTTEEFASKLF